MDGGDDEVELGKTVVGEIERAVVPDVALDAREQADAIETGVERANARRLLQRSALVEAVGHGQRLAVVGDRQVLEAGGARRSRHRLEVFLAVGGIGVAVQVATQVAVG